MKNDLDAKVEYQAAISLFVSEGQIQWSRYNAILIVNTILISLIGFVYSKDFNFPVALEYFFKFVPFIGLLLCYLWEKMAKRGFDWIDFWITKAREIEEQPNNKNLINPVIKGYEKKLKNDEMFNTPKSSSIVIRFFALVYFFILFNNLLILVLS